MSTSIRFVCRFFLSLALSLPFFAHTAQGAICYQNCTETINGVVIGNIYAGGELALTMDATGNTLDIVQGGSIDFGDGIGGVSGAGNVSNNIATMNSNGIVDGNLVGGRSVSGFANQNSAFLNNGTVGSLIGGQSRGDAIANAVGLTGGAVSNDVFGGTSSAGSALVNNLTISGGTVSGFSYGGYGQINATQNTVTVSGSAITGQVYGGLAVTGVASRNKVEILGGETGQVLGGAGEIGALNNSAIISGTAIVNGGFAGGQAENGDADGNTIDINGGTVNGLAAAGRAVNGAARNNIARATAGVISDLLVGGAGTTAVNNNTLEISGTIDAQTNVVAGLGQGTDTTADQNIVRMSGGSVGAGLYGARVNGEVTNNSADVSGGAVTGAVVGGWTSTSSASDNQASISGAATVGGNLIGGHSATGTASNNSATSNGGTLTGSLIGGESLGNATGNSAVITAGSIGANAYGGKSDAGNAEGNTLSISDGTVTQNIYAGYAQNDAKTNTVTVSGTAVVSEVYGGLGVTGVATGNKAEILGGQTGQVLGGAGEVGASNNSAVISGTALVNGGFAGGQAQNGDADGNTIDINGGTVNGLAAAGRAVNGAARNNIARATAGVITNLLVGGAGTTAVNNNTLEISGTVDAQTNVVAGLGQGTDTTADQNIVRMSGGSVGAGLYAGRADGAVTNNTADISNGSVAGGAYAGWSTHSSASDNTITIRNGTVGQDLVGGHSQNGTASNNKAFAQGGTVTGAAIGGQSQGDATTNTVAISGGTVGSAYGGKSTAGNATSNTVQISNTTATGDIFGGHSDNANAIGNTVQMLSGQVGGSINGGSGAGEVRNNLVSIENGRIDGDVSAAIGQGAAQVSSNTLSILAGDVGGSLYGGRTFSGGNATDNLVLVNTGLIQGDVYGGFGNGGGLTQRNTVTLLGGRIIGGVYGGDHGDKTGNTLNLHGYIGEVREVNNFQNYSVILSDSVANGMTQVHITGNTPTDLSGAQITDFAFAPGNTRYRAGDRMYIIDKATQDGSFVDRVFYNTPKGPSALYDVLVSGQDGAFTANILGKQANPQSQSLNTGRLATLSTLNRGGDLVIRAGLEQAWTAVPCYEEGTFGMFSAVDYGDYSLDNLVDLKTWSFMAGLGWRSRQNCDYGFMGGIFFEAGKGDFDGSQHYSKAGRVKYSGDVEYYGAGILSRYRFENRFRLEGSLRYGRQETDQHTKSYAGNQQHKYDLSSNYFGLHVGAGYDTNLTDRVNLDVSAVYQWTHLDSDSAKILDEKIHFNSVNSHLARFGARLNYEATSTFKPYAGLYYEHEFDGLAKSYNTHAGLYNKDARIRGSSGIGELGLHITPSPSRDLVFKVAVTGSTGKREGVGGQLSLNWNF